jgi:hypothetical protein
MSTVLSSWVQPPQTRGTPTFMLFRKTKPSPDPALEHDFHKRMGRKGKPKELRWIELADKALSESPRNPAQSKPRDTRKKAA